MSAELCILDFKTTWSEIQKPSQTAAKQGEAELRILDFKTTWSEFQKPSQTAAKRGKAELRILNFKTTWSEFQNLPSVGPKQLCVLRGYFLVSNKKKDWLNMPLLKNAQFSSYQA